MRSGALASAHGDMVRSAEFSPCGRYRYALRRQWGETGAGEVCFILLNPSTADALVDDPTVRRCIGFARDWGYGGLRIGNLFAFRATDPKRLLAQDDPVGEGNDAALMALVAGAALRVAAWGVHGAHLGRGDAVRRLLPGLRVLKLTRQGAPGHPLYLPRTARPVEWD